MCRRLPRGAPRSPRARCTWCAAPASRRVLLKNARTEFKEEAEEIAHYTAIQKLAETVGDKETAQLAKAILREEKRMAGFLEKLIPRLTKSVVQAEIPAASATADAADDQPPPARRAAAARRAGRPRSRSDQAREDDRQLAARPRRGRAERRRARAAARSGTSPAHRRERLALAASRPLALTGGAQERAPPACRRGGSAAPGLAQSHRARKPACAKSLNPATANTVVAVRPAAGMARRRPTKPSAVHAPTQRLHVTSSPSARRTLPPRGRLRPTGSSTNGSRTHEPMRSARSSSRPRRWRRSAESARRAEDRADFLVPVAGRASTRPVSATA